MRLSVSSALPRVPLFSASPCSADRIIDWEVRDTEEDKKKGEGRPREREPEERWIWTENGKWGGGG